MNKNHCNFLFSAVFLISAIFFSTCNKPKVSSPSGQLTGKDKWTIMLYDDADFNGAYDPFDDFRKEIIYNENVNVLVLRDKEFEEAFLYEIKEDTFYLLKEMGEINMGEKETLSEFLNFAKRRYPAERYILAFYDHGGGWEGVCWDKSHANDNLSMNEIQTALTEQEGVDLILNTAPCLMGAIESAYELRNCTDIYIGSENFSGYCWWFNTIKQINTDLMINPDITTDELAINIIDYIYQYSFDWEDWSEVLTMSAIKTDELNEAIVYLDSLSLKYCDSLENFISIIDDDNFVVTDFVFTVDLYDFLLQIENFETNNEILNFTFKIREKILESVIAECHGSDFPLAHGLTVYFPVGSYYDTDYGEDEIGLDFSLDTHWDELLDMYFNNKVSFDYHKNKLYLEGNAFNQKNIHN